MRLRDLMLAAHPAVLLGIGVIPKSWWEHNLLAFIHTSLMEVHHCGPHQKAERYSKGLGRGLCSHGKDSAATGQSANTRECCQRAMAHFQFWGSPSSLGSWQGQFFVFRWSPVGIQPIQGKRVMSTIWKTASRVVQRAKRGTSVGSVVLFLQGKVSCTPCLFL